MGIAASSIASGATAKKTMTEQTPLERYKDLLQQAGALEEMAKEEATGGSTYWRDMTECTAGAIASQVYVPPESMTYRLQKEQIWAIYQVAGPYLDQIRIAAAAFLRAQAARMKSDLERQTIELLQVIDSFPHAYPASCQEGVR
jgi:hypothetical protein